VLFLARLAVRLRRLRPDVLHTRNWGGIDGVLAGRLAGLPAIVHGEHGWEMDDLRGASAKRQLIRRTLSYGINRISCVSRDIERWLVRDVGVQCPVEQIYNGVDTDEFQPRPDRDEARRELGIEAGHVAIGHVGRAVEVKNHDGLLRSFLRVGQQVDKLTLVCVGDGERLQELRARAVPGVRFVGHRSDVARCMAAFDLFVLPSHNEGISNTILEAMATGLPVVATRVGGNDELIFDGGSFLMDARGRVQLQLPLFESDLGIVELPTLGAGVSPDEVEEPGRIEQLEAGLVLGIRDYFLKQNLPPGAVIGLSGGIDSAVTAHLAVEALGTERVTGVAMPGPYSSDHSVDDAVELAERLGIELRRVDIRPMFDAYLRVFGSLFGEREDYGLAQQNIQSRIRGAVLMAVSNAENRLVLATGNKSELSSGYCTLYGDTVGGLAVLGDVYKRDVYALARHANRNGVRIPTRTIEKPPSAELAPDQLDSDDLPDYAILDGVLEQIIERGRNRETVEPPAGCSRETAVAIARRLDRNEYKRRQTPLVLRASPKAFGSGRRMPIVHRYGDQ